MNMDEMVHWYEGLFLQPQHLQGMQNRLIHSIEESRGLAHPYAYGVIKAQLSTDELENFLIRFEQLHVLMPSGLEVKFPEGANMPALNFKEAYEERRGDLTVYLGIPVYTPNQSNVVEGENPDWRINRRYHIIEKEALDENYGDQPYPIKLRRLNARLVLDHDDHEDLELLPLFKIAQSSGEEVGKPRQDPNYAGPCYCMSGSDSLRALVWELANQLTATRSELVVQLNRGGYNVESLRGIQMDQILRLRTLNVHSARLISLCEAPMVSPFTMYMQLRDLLGELAALQPDRDTYEVDSYDHDNPKPVFIDIIKRIRSMMRGMMTGNFLRVPFEEQGKMHVASLKDEHIRKLSDWYLCIQSREDRAVINDLLEDGDRFKLISTGMAATRVRGLTIKEERYPPMELPANNQLYYYRFIPDDSERMWQRIQEERSMAAIWPGSEDSDFKLTLYVTVPATGE